MNKTFLHQPKLSSPNVFALYMLVFLAIVVFAGLMLSDILVSSFASNPGLNGLIFAVAILGVALSFNQVLGLRSEVNFVNSIRLRDGKINLPAPSQLLRPLARMLNKASPVTLVDTHAISDNVEIHLDEKRDILRYIGSLLIFLGLLGTFWGLSKTIFSIANVIQSLQIETTDTEAVFTDLKVGLSAPLSGMGMAFSSSLFGLLGSIVVGFLDFQVNQAQKSLAAELRNWMEILITDPNRKAGVELSDTRYVDTIRQSVSPITEELRTIRMDMLTERKEFLDFMNEYNREARSMRNALEQTHNLATGKTSGPSSGGKQK